MTASGERGIVCRMQIEPESIKYLQKITLDKSEMLKTALEPVIDMPSRPNFLMNWNEEEYARQS